jgi:hypothetical protein
LYRNIEHSLESQYESLLRLSASLSPPKHPSGAASVNLSRSSPFGPLSQISSRRTFAYLIATLNASHPDYDFSHILRPTDFRRERSFKAVMNNIDSTLYNLQPSPAISLQVPLQSNYAAASSPAVNQAWGPQMWALVDKEMTLKECLIYSYVPEEDPYDGEEGAIWSLNYFFFNKTRKRVAYFYVRGIPVMSHSPRSALAKRGAGGLSRDYGAKKRARYWLGDRADAITNGCDLDGREADLDLWNPEDEDDIEFDGSLDGDEYCDDYDEANDEPDEQVYNGPIRGVSEDIASQMEME